MIRVIRGNKMKTKKRKRKKEFDAQKGDVPNLQKVGIVDPTRQGKPTLRDHITSKLMLMRPGRSGPG